MKKLNKLLSVGLSLAMCAGMVVPAFAHVVTIEGVDGSTDVETVQAGVDMIANSESKTGNIQMTEDANERVVIKGGDVTIDLNGHDIDAEGKGVAITVAGDKTELTIKDNTAKYDEEDKQTYVGDGHITGGTGGQGAGVIVKGGASATLESGSISKNNASTNGGGVYVENGTFTMNGGEISNNNGGNAGGGVYVNTEAAIRQDGEAKFVMTGGEISNNTAVSGGGVGAYTRIEYSNAGPDGYAAIDITGGEIKGNTATTGDGGGVAAQWNTVNISGADITGNKAGDVGGGVWLSNSNTTIIGGEISKNKVTSTIATNGGGGIFAGGQTITINGTEISGNTSTKNGGGISGDANMTLTGVTIKDNEAAGIGGGMYVYGKANAVVEGDSKIYNNTATGWADDVFKAEGATIKLPSAALMDVTGQDGKPITGWYWDNVYGWGNEDGNSPYSSQNNRATGGTYVGALWLKAAHDKYFNVVYTDGLDGAVFENEAFSLENNSAIPVYNKGEAPTREGYIFTGWQLADGTDIDVETGIVNGELTLVAQWACAHASRNTVQENLVPAEPGVDGSYDSVDYCAVCGVELSRETVAIAALPIPATPDEADAGDDVEIDDEAVPLAAGPVTRAEFIDYLWRHEGAPASDGVCTFTDVAEDHEFILALAWAEQNGVAVADEDGAFQPDELVTVADVREFLGNFARTFSVTMRSLTTLTGADDEAVLNCDEVLAEFFGEELPVSREEEAA